MQPDSEISGDVTFHTRHIKIYLQLCLYLSSGTIILEVMMEEMSPFITIQRVVTQMLFFYMEGNITIVVVRVQSAYNLRFVRAL